MHVQHNTRCMLRKSVISNLVLERSVQTEASFPIPTELLDVCTETPE